MAVTANSRKIKTVKHAKERGAFASHRHLQSNISMPKSDPRPVIAGESKTTRRAFWERSDNPPGAAERGGLGASQPPFRIGGKECQV